VEIFADTTRHDLYENDRHVQTFAPELTTLQQQVLELAGVGHSSYDPWFTTSSN
jgi:hypothetical protein